MDAQSLYNLLYIFFNWHPARIKTFSELIWGIVQSKSVTLKELAIHVSSKGQIKARIAKVERLLLKQAIDYVALGKIILKLLCIAGKIKIAIDRTNWQFGNSNLNFFVAAVVFGNISLPIATLMLDKKGNSATSERKKLIEQILEIIPLEGIEIILADREFVGEEWIEYLTQQKVPFAIRLKKNEQIKHPNGGRMSLGRYFSNMHVGNTRAVVTKLYNSQNDIKITCLQLECEQLFLASNVLIGDSVLIAYKQRWSIERTFKALKTSGFNFESTHITDQEKLKKLFAITSLSLAVCVIAGEIKNQIIPIKIKNHGRKIYSLFTYGFDWLKDYFSNKQKQDLTSFFELLREKIMRVVQ